MSNYFKVGDWVKIRRTDDITSNTDLVDNIGLITDEDCSNDYEISIGGRYYWFRKDSLELVEDKDVSLYDVLRYIQLFRDDPLTGMKLIVNS